jgi:hypothetical protein
MGLRSPLDLTRALSFLDVTGEQVPPSRHGRMQSGKDFELSRGLG